MYAVEVYNICWDFRNTHYSGDSYAPWPTYATYTFVTLSLIRVALFHFFFMYLEECVTHINLHGIKVALTPCWSLDGRLEYAKPTRDIA